MNAAGILLVSVWCGAGPSTGPTSRPFAPVVVRETKREYRVTAGEFAVTVRRDRGVVTRLALGDRAFTGAMFALRLADFERPGADVYHFAPGVGQDKVHLEWIERGPERARLRVTWKSDRAVSVETIEVVAGCPWVRQTYELRPTQPLAEAQITLMGGVGGFSAGADCVFYPDRERVGAIPWENQWMESGRFRRAPGWVMAYDPNTRAGLCLGVPPGSDLDRYDYCCLGPPESRGQKNFPKVLKLVARSRRLDLHAKPVYRFEMVGYVARTPREAEATFARACGSRRVPIKPVSIHRVWPTKLVFDNRSPAEVTVTVDNHTDTVQTVQLAVTLESRLDRVRTLGARDVTLAAQGRVCVPFAWTTDDEEYGFEAVACIRRQGRVVDRASETFAVTTDWPKVFHIACGGGATRMRENYVCATQFFSWMPADGRLTPGPGPYLGFGHQQRTCQDTAATIQALNRQGLRAQLYWWIGVIPPGRLNFMDDPTACLFTDAGQLAVYHGLAVPHLYRPAYRRFAADQLCRTIAKFGWDSVMFDEVPNLSQFATKYYDWRGRPAGATMGTDPDAIGGQWLEEIKATVRKRFPRFVVMGNGSRTGPRVYRGTEIDLFEVGGGGSYVTDPAKRAGRWTTLAEMMRAENADWDRRGFHARPYYTLVAAPMGGPTSTAGLIALAMAYRYHLYSWQHLPALSTQGDPKVRALRMAMRYSRYIYRLTLRPVEPDAIGLQVQAPERVLWRDFAYLGPDPDDGTVLVLHLVNLPPRETIWRTEVPPVPRRDVPVVFTVPTGLRVRDAWVTRPETAPRALPLVPRVVGRRCHLLVPHLLTHDVIVVRMRTQ